LGCAQVGGEKKTGVSTFERGALANRGKGRANRALLELLKQEGENGSMNRPRKKKHASARKNKNGSKKGKSTC